VAKIRERNARRNPFKAKTAEKNRAEARVERRIHRKRFLSLMYMNQKIAKCIVCQKNAIARFSPDIDIQGIAFCRSHKDIVTLAYMLLMQGDRIRFEELIKPPRKLRRKKKSPPLQIQK